MRRMIASFFGSGLILGRIRGSDAGSGTLAALVAFPLAFLLGHTLRWPGQLMAAMAISLISVWASDRLSTTEGDAGWIVIDEVAGTFVALIGLGLGPAIVAWLVFRVADIVKSPYTGVAWAESLPGGWGITVDDVLAGALGLLVGHLLQLAVG